MIRPDQERFDRFAGHLAIFDDILGRFCETNAFEMEMNANRLPCRVLRRQRSALDLIGVYLEGDWKTMDYLEHLPCTFDICSYFESPPDDGYKLYKIDRVLASESSFPSLASKLDVLLQRSLVTFDEWTPEVIVATGEEIENLKRMHEQGGLI